MAELHLIRFCALGAYFGFDRFAVIVIISQRRMNVGQRELLEIGDNLLRSLPLKLMPDISTVRL